MTLIRPILSVRRRIYSLTTLVLLAPTIVAPIHASAQTPTETPHTSDLVVEGGWVSPQGPSIGFIDQGPSLITRIVSSSNKPVAADVWLGLNLTIPGQNTVQDQRIFDNVDEPVDVTTTHFLFSLDIGVQLTGGPNTNRLVPRIGVGVGPAGLIEHEAVSHSDTGEELHSETGFWPGFSWRSYLGVDVRHSKELAIVFDVFYEQSWFSRFDSSVRYLGVSAGLAFGG